LLNKETKKPRGKQNQNARIDDLSINLQTGTPQPSEEEATDLMVPEGRCKDVWEDLTTKTDTETVRHNPDHPGQIGTPIKLRKALQDLLLEEDSL